jgi:cytochrome c-type biogenesis protein CcmH
MKTLKSLFMMLFLFGALLVVRSASAQDATPRPVTADDVNRIAKKLFCPVCENVPLDVCGTQACADWRSEIRSMLSQGKSEQEIKAYFADRYGQRVLATPEARGLNTLVWVLPVVGVIAGVVVVVVALRRMAPGALDAEVGQAVVSYEDLDPEYVARLERDLQEMSG